LRKPRFARQRKRACGAPSEWLRCGLRQRKFFLVEYVSTLPAKNFLFLASLEASYFFGFFRHQHPSVASLQTESGISTNHIAILSDRAFAFAPKCGRQARPAR
ncbi:hypothetical protein, partial [uncultured Desulfovibrio sp.]|uniref:hypothetical protein n=1 Tax=uncultured Desulfovibrio sp. TaxID=167968 RepID=UPI0026080BF3